MSKTNGIAKALYAHRHVMDVITGRIKCGRIKVDCRFRSGWIKPGEDLTVNEFCILLSLGVRIRGDVVCAKLSNPYMEYADEKHDWVVYSGASSDVLSQYISLIDF